MGRKQEDVEAAWCFDRYVRVLARSIDQRASAHGLSSCEWFVLNELERCDATSLRDLARASAVSSPAASRAICRLVGAGFVEVRQVSGNRRVSAISLTKAGMGFLEKARSDEKSWPNYHEIMPPEDILKLTRSLAALSGSILQTK